MEVIEKGVSEGFIDQAHLKHEAYVDSRNLSARSDIYRFAVPRVRFSDWALSHLPSDLGAVLDVGCGPGTYLARLIELGRAHGLVGVDLSSGMLREIQSGRPSLCVGDAQALPFKDRSFDTVLCMHVLYHVPDIRRAIGELGRVLRSSGIALVATNGTQHHQRLRDVFDEIVTDLSGEKVDPVLSSDRRFRLEDGQAMLEVEFKSVARYGLPRELRLTELAPVLRYLQSVRSFHESELPAKVDWDEVVARVAALIQNDIAHEGSFRNPIYEGVFVCRRPRAT